MAEAVEQLLREARTSEVQPSAWKRYRKGRTLTSGACWGNWPGISCPVSRRGREGKTQARCKFKSTKGEVLYVLHTFALFFRAFLGSPSRPLSERGCGAVGGDPGRHHTLGKCFPHPLGKPGESAWFGNGILSL